MYNKHRRIETTIWNKCLEKAFNFSLSTQTQFSLKESELMVHQTFRWDNSRENNPKNWPHGD